MNGPENELKAATGGAEEVRGELQSLRTLLAAALILLIAFSACIDYFYLSPQVKEEKARADQATAMLSVLSHNAGDFWNKLVDYSKAHPAFTPVIDKWKAHVSMHGNGSAPASK